jgi:o-succinylbenzoate---CoA ligase
MRCGPLAKSTAFLGSGGGGDAPADAGADDGLSIRSAAREVPKRVALVMRDRSVTFAELAALVGARVDALRSAWSETERPVTFVAEPGVSELVEMYAALEARVPFVPLHPRWSDDERASLGSRAARATVPSSVAAVLFTSGTSGEPKGVMLSRGAFIASAAASEANLGWTEDDRWLLAMPFAHAGGLSILTRCLAARRTVVVEPGFDADATLRSIARHRVTLLSVVPTMLSALLDRAEPHSPGFASLRAVLVGGARCPDALLKRARSFGVPVLLTYGSTETCSQVATQRPDERAGRTEVEPAGYVLPGVDARIAKSANASDSETGAIEVRGPIVMDGYLGEQPLPRGSWFRTGDIGWTDERGGLHIIGRSDDTIITGGENVHPAEVEPALRAHPRVRDAAVFGVPDEKWGQTVAAALVLAPDAWDVSESDLAAIVAEACESFAAFKRPRRLVVVDALPLNAIGKVDRRAVRALAERSLD